MNKANPGFKKQKKKAIEPKETTLNELVLKTQEFRNQVAQMFIDCIEENASQQHWHRGWRTAAPINLISEAQYHGINFFYLQMAMFKNGWNDNRFITMAQIKKEHYMIKKGSKGLRVEYWFPYDFKNKKQLTWAEYNRLTAGQQNPEENEAETENETNLKQIGLKAFYYVVFNAEQLNGVPAKMTLNLEPIKPDDIVERLAKNMQVNVTCDGGDSAFYNPAEDKISLPALQAFLSNYDFASTVLHELAHATGAASRLNRDQSGRFGTPEYAEEELIAEITSCMMSQHLGDAGETRDYGNHVAYVQNWITAIRTDEKHAVLFRAIKEAEKAARFMEQKLSEG